MIADLVNGGFELLGGLILLINIFKLRRDKKVAGVSVLPVIFFTLWGFWNLYYYPSLGQWASFWGGIVVVTVNSVWIGMAVYYGRNKQSEEGADSAASKGGSITQ